MKKLLVLITAALTSVALSTTNATAQNKTKYVVLITIDGFRPEFYLDSTYGMMTVRHLMKNGVATEGANPVFPSVTYPNHTTLVTGVTPAKHGIYYNTPFEPEGATGKWFWDHDLIKVPTLWTAMHDAGKTTACVRWPVTVGAPIDYRIPEYWNYNDRSDARPYMAKETNPLSLWKEVQDNATGFLNAEDMDTKNNELVEDENEARMTSYIIRKYKPNFIAVHLACTDHYEHEEGRDSYMVRAAVAGADRAVKSIVEGIGGAGITDSTMIIITGDHGFENIYRSFYPNYILKQAGLIGDIKKDDWKAQFHTSGGSAFLELKTPGDKQTVEKVRSLLKQLPDSLKQYFAIIDEAKMKTIGADPHSPFALSGLRGTTFGASSGKLLETFKTVKGTHGFYPDHKEIRTGFVASGPDLRCGELISGMNLLDVAPLIVKVMNIPFPKTDGVVPPALLK
jgi:predicted AlkP superfamily pyrophosphatase or phosphodiesterase